MKRVLILSGLLVFLSCCQFAALADEATATPTGIPLDVAWKKQLYAYAVKNVQHPAWGFAHAERNYQNTLALATAEKVTVDKDVLFAAAFLHDLGGLAGFAEPKVDHAVKSAELAGPLLTGFGFPTEKIPAVLEIIRSHVYYKSASKDPVASLFRDADILDFLGTMGVARMLSFTMDAEGGPGKLPLIMGSLKDFESSMPSQLVSPTAKKWSQQRLKEMADFQQSLQNYTFGGKAI